MSGSSLIDHLVNENQDPAVVRQLCSRVKDILTKGETIEYVAVQKKPVANIAPDSMICQ